MRELLWTILWLLVVATVIGLACGVAGYLVARIKIDVTDKVKRMKEERRS